MKVLIVGFYTKTYMPYIYKYEEILKAHHVEYDVVCFDRDKTVPAIHQDNIFTFSQKMGVNKWKKIIPYIQYIRYTKKVIKKTSYDKLIILTTVPAVLLYSILVNLYPNGYIFDYRDYSYERIPMYKKIVDKIISNSYSTFISSKGFLHYLSESPKINLIHNLSNASNCKITANMPNSEKIVIGFAGFVRYYDVNTALMKQVMNADHYELQYFGTMYDDCDLPGFAKALHIDNVKFFDTYSNHEKPQIYENFTFVNSIYSLSSKEVAYAIPNRLYDAALFKVPIIVAKGTFLQEIVEKYELGFAIDIFSENLLQKIDHYLSSFDASKFTTNCEAFLFNIKQDEKNFKNILSHFVASGDGIRNTKEIPK